MIRIINLSKKFGKHFALKNININLPNKGLIGIIGESGSGKSTLLNALSLMDNHYEGQIIINKRNILRFNEEKRDLYHLNIGYIFQVPYLFNFCSVYENVQYLSLIKGKKDKIDNVLKSVGLEKYKNKKVNALSGGQRQRVSIASALISKPKILLCDEPTGALDSENSIKVMEILKKVSEDILVIVVSHDNKLINKYADQIIELKNGELVNKVDNCFNGKKMKLNKIKFLPYLSFLFKFSLKNILVHQKRTILTSIMVSFGLIGIIISILLKDGFSSFFIKTLNNYESNKYTYCYKTEDSEELLVDISTFEEDFKDYERGYFYKYDFQNENDFITNKIELLDNYLYLDFNNLGYLQKDKENYSLDEIGLECSKEYLDYLCYLFSLNSIIKINDYLKNNEVLLKFTYLDDSMNLNFCLRLKKIKESKSDYTYFVHSNPLFLKDYFNDYLTFDLSNTNKILLLPYLKEIDNQKNDLLLNENKKKYDYLFDNYIYEKNYTFVIKANYYRIGKELADEMSTLINCPYYFVINKGFDTLAKFPLELVFQTETRSINGKEITFVPLTSTFENDNQIMISSGLYNLFQKKEIIVEGYNYTHTLYINKIIEEDELVIYQNSKWSTDLFLNLFNFKDYECYASMIAFKIDNQKDEKLLKEFYSDFSIICPLKEVGIEIDNILEKVQLVLLILSSFCIIISFLLMAIIIFINTIEQSKLIAVLRINGIKKFDVVIIFILESLLVGLLSYLIAVWFSFIFSVELNMVFNMLLKGNDIEIIKLKKDTLISVLKSIIFMSFISGLIPSLLAAKKKPLKILKG